eukprot:CAMPEP_0170196722 /NCGR_PEP_ID=MMETSP0040_2-20121228/64635_1 /TAXON_ID=641309 /ORGANISM="Lotharella oceanica, Strain CCMP622" /LENGTH=119 /DNA_ID=CAMNT_0010446231 /DNA_START=95 /DNA_END=454 /DNA_ORIENTATION=+
MKQLWLRLDDLRESAYRITETGSGVDYLGLVNEAWRASTWRVDLESLFSLLNEIMFQTWRGYIHAQRAPHIFTTEFQKLSSGGYPHYPHPATDTAEGVQRRGGGASEIGGTSVAEPSSE